ncbi:MAG: 30S ribosomal protein S9 [Candidatus Aenigmarchaeota archaeon]|nr:30S ribosomal protein S9 [Candidatus Aenigmarchaeota archaeon]
MKKKDQKVLFTTGKRRLAIARAKVIPGSGVVKINSTPLDIWGSEVLRLWVKEPLLLAGDWANKVNVDVSVRSGGVVGQAEAARMAIAKGLVEFSKSKDLRSTFMQYNRNMLVYDPRRNEPHHAGGASKRGSRRHKQRSKR